MLDNFTSVRPAEINLTIYFQCGRMYYLVMRDPSGNLSSVDHSHTLGPLQDLLHKYVKRFGEGEYWIEANGYRFCYSVTSQYNSPTYCFYIHWYDGDISGELSALTSRKFPVVRGSE